jgi:hypothetical protein
MIRKIQFTLFITILAVSFVFAQNLKVKDHHKILVDDSKTSGEVSTQSILPLVMPVVDPLVGDSIGYTQYDYFTNSVCRDQIVYYNGIHFSPMLRGPYATPTRRAVTYIRQVGANYVGKAAFDTSVNSGWGAIDVCLTGTQGIGTIGIVGHHATASTTPSKLAIWDGTSSFVVSQFDPSTDPSIQFSKDNIFLATSGARAKYMFYKTTNFGTSFTKWDSISRFSPNPIFWVENGGVEVGMSKSFNEKYLIHFGTNAGIINGGNHLYNGTRKDSCDNLWAITSTDFGATWTGKTIAVDGDVSTLPTWKYTSFVDTVTYTVGGTTYNVVLNQNVDFKAAPLWENFGQVDMCVDNSGNIYGLANGYGLVIAKVPVTRPGTTIKDTVTISGGSCTLMLYYSSKTNSWQSIGDPRIDTMQAITDGSMGTYPTNSIGQAYPSISCTPDGKYLFAMWTSPALTSSNKLDTVSGIWWRDAMYRYSTDGGTTWSAITVIGANNKFSEAFGHASQHLQVTTGTPKEWVAHIIYLKDNEPTVGPFSSVYTNNAVMYRIVKGTYVPSGVEDGNTVSSFELQQNYPNPFNPSTSITFNLANKNLVNLKVFDVLGREVATLVNEVKEAGSHTVDFDASKLASGMYIYTLTSGNFTATKKMMFLK